MISRDEFVVGKAVWLFDTQESTISEHVVKKGPFRSMYDVFNDDKACKYFARYAGTFFFHTEAEAKSELIDWLKIDLEIKEKQASSLELQADQIRQKIAHISAKLVELGVEEF